VGVLPGMGGAMGGGFSPSVPSVHSSLDNMSHGMGFMGPETGSVGSHASVYGSVGAPRGDGGGVLPGDADGIDDVLRLQPWLQDG